MDLERLTRTASRRFALASVGYLALWAGLEVATQGISGSLQISLWYPPAGVSLGFLLL